MHSPTHFRLDFQQLLSHPVCARLAMQQITAMPGFAPGYRSLHDPENIKPRS